MLMAAVFILMKQQALMLFYLDILVSLNRVIFASLNINLQAEVEEAGNGCLPTGTIFMHPCSGVYIAILAKQVA